MQPLAAIIKTLHNSQLYSLQPEWLKVKIELLLCLIQTTTKTEEQRCSFTNSYPKHYSKVTGWLYASVATSMLIPKEAGLAPKTGLEVVGQKEISVSARTEPQPVTVSTKIAPPH